MAYDGDEERRDRICRLAEEAFDRTQQADKESWESYMTMGEGFLCGRDEAFIKSGTNDINSPVYKRAFSAWLKRYPKLAKFDRSDRAKLMFVMDHRGEIEQWRADLDWTKRSKMSHPTTVLNKWKKEHPEAFELKKPRRVVPIEKHKRDVGTMQHEIEDQQAHIAELEAAVDAGSLFDLKKDSVAAIAKVIVGTVTASRARDLAKEIVKLLGGAQQRTKIAGPLTGCDRTE